MKNLQQAIEENKKIIERLLGDDYVRNNTIENASDVIDRLARELTQLITSREQEIREETIMKCMALVNTHTEHNGNYCDTGEDMDWACRSECVDMAEARLELYLAQQKENK